MVMAVSVTISGSYSRGDGRGRGAHDVLNVLLVVADRIEGEGQGCARFAELFLQNCTERQIFSETVLNSFSCFHMKILYYINVSLQN